MAKVNMPLWSGTSNGKLGDIVFMRRLGKNIVRMRVTPANPKSVKQTIVRDNLSGLGRAWHYHGQSGSVALKKVDKSTDPWTTTDATFNYLTDAEKATWHYVWEFTGENMRRLMNNLDPVREKPSS